MRRTRFVQGGHLLLRVSVAAAALQCRYRWMPQALMQLSNAAAMMLLRVQYCSF